MSTDKKPRRRLYTIAAAIGLGLGTMGIAAAASTPSPAPAQQQAQIRTDQAAETPETDNLQEPSLNGSTQAPESETASESDEATALHGLATISSSDAEAAALAAVPGGTVNSVELGNENGSVVYQVDMTDANGQAVEVKVNAGIQGARHFGHVRAIHGQLGSHGRILTSGDDLGTRPPGDPNQDVVPGREGLEARLRRRLPRRPRQWRSRRIRGRHRMPVSHFDITARVGEDGLEFDNRAYATDGNQMSSKEFWRQNDGPETYSWHLYQNTNGALTAWMDGEWKRLTEHTAA